MDNLEYYYVLVSNPYDIKKTELLDELIILLYEGKADFISEVQRINNNLPDNYFSWIRKRISLYSERVPMYDIVYNHIYLISKERVYSSIIDPDRNYRFVDKNFYKSLKEIENPSQVDLENLRILSFYDIDSLYQTYTDVFYKSFILDSYITNCRRPSFDSKMDHISPYYKLNELYYLAYDWNLTNKANLTESEINHFCNQISKYDIPAQTLLDHQMYIYDSKAIGLVKHYSLFGSYYMNLYLRSNKCTIEKKTYEKYVRNLYLENQIQIMIRLIRNAPIFTKDHTVYRFIEDDSYLSHLNVGDVYKDCSFMSTTRNPFYYKENYAFGYILLKIKIPKNIKGIGICIESYSNFPKEEEIIFPPTTSYRLTKIIDKNDVEEFSNIFKLRVIKKYEFEWIDNDYIHSKSDIVLDMPNAIIPEINTIDLRKILSDDNVKYLNMSDRLRYFRTNYVNNPNNQFISIIGKHSYIFNLDAYDSSSVYKQFFYNETVDGIMITTSNPKSGNINILMEMGPEIHVNYYFKYSLTDTSLLVNLDRPEWIEWFSLLAYVVGSQKIIFHSNYVLHTNPTDSIEEARIKTRYTYSENIYEYLKNSKKFFTEIEITPNFDYAELDRLAFIPVKDYIHSSDKNELYRIYKSSNIIYMKDFYLYIVENFPRHIKDIENKLEDIYQNPETNPFKNISYTLDAWRYLYNRNLVFSIPPEKSFQYGRKQFKKLIGTKKIPKFENRLRTFLIAS